MVMAQLLSSSRITFSLVNNISVFKSIWSGDKSCKFLTGTDIYAMYSQKFSEHINRCSQTTYALWQIFTLKFFVKVASSSSKTCKLCNHILHTTDLQSALLRYILEQQNSFLKGYTIRVETVGCVKQIAEVIISPLEDDKMLIV